jgi:hypothetical protein
MKKEFPEYYGTPTTDRVLEMFKNGLFEFKPQEVTQEIYPAEEKRDKLFDTATFVFDASVLLNVYPLSEEAAAAFFRVCEKLDGRVWISYQAATEYHCELWKTIGQGYRALSKVSISLLAMAENNRQSHFLNSPKIKNAFNELMSKLEVERAVYLQRCHQRRDQIADMFRDRVGHKPSDEDLKKMLEKAKERYETDQPPGYKDQRKDDNKYGDAIGWLQTLDMASEKQAPVIVVIDDLKADWRLEDYKHDKQGPRPELIVEMKERTKQDMWLYSMESFVALASKHFGISVAEEVSTEIKDLARKDIYPDRPFAEARARATAMLDRRPVEFQYADQPTAWFSRLPKDIQDKIDSFVMDLGRAGHSRGDSGHATVPDTSVDISWTCIAPRCIEVTEIRCDLSLLGLI